MPVKFKKKIRKMRGQRTCGYGMLKKHRGGGKHKFTYMLQNEPDVFDKSGFTPVRRNRFKCVNISQLEKMSENGRVVFTGKVLGSGKISNALTVVCARISAVAREKIEKAGGKVECGADEQSNGE